jgi:hypothetical protein
MVRADYDLAATMYQAECGRIFIMGVAGECSDDLLIVTLGRRLASGAAGS